MSVAPHPDVARILGDRDRLRMLEECELSGDARDPILDRLVGLAARLTGTPMAWLALLEAGRAILPAAVGLPPAVAAARQLPLRDALCVVSVVQVAPLVIADLAAHPTLRDHPAGAALGIAAYAAIPLTMPEGHTLGTLAVADVAPRRWSQDELDRLRDLADLVTRQLEQRAGTAVLERLVRAREAEKRALGGHATYLAAILEAIDDGVIATTVDGEIELHNDAAFRLLGHPTGSTAELEALQRRLAPRAADHVTPVPADQLPLPRALRGEVVRGAELYLPEPAPGEAGLGAGARWLSVNATPIRDRRGAVIGAVAVSRDVSERKANEERLLALSHIDDLTGLFNRRGFVAAAGPHLRIGARAGRPLHLLFADLDGLKRINDQLGHDVGDRAIVAAARVLVDSLRVSDVVARLGGDELVALAIDAADISAILWRIEDRCQLFNRDAGAPFALSISAGAVRYEPELDGSIDALLARADAAMYAAKRARRASAGA